MDKCYAEDDRLSSLDSYVFFPAQVLQQILQEAGDDLTRENIMNLATNLSEITTDFSLPGMAASTSKTDYHLNQQFQMMALRPRTLGIVRPNSGRRNAHRLNPVSKQAIAGFRFAARPNGPHPLAGSAS